MGFWALLLIRDMTYVEEESIEKQEEKNAPIQKLKSPTLEKTVVKTNDLLEEEQKKTTENKNYLFDLIDITQEDEKKDKGNDLLDFGELNEKSNTNYIQHDLVKNFKFI